MRARTNPTNWLEVLSMKADEGFGDFDDFYSYELRPTSIETAYFGRNVIWIGDEGKMLRVRASEIEPIESNIFDADKLYAVRDALDNHPERIYMHPGYVMATQVGPAHVQESIEYEDNPLTTGDDGLDAWLVDNDDCWGFDSQKEAQEALDQAVLDRDGDLGSWRYQLRDGNHRAWGALLGGEPYIYVYLYENQYEDAKRAATGKSGSIGVEEAAELLAMLE